MTDTTDGAVQPTIEELQQQLEQERQWRLAAIQGAHEYAVARNFCTEFDTIIKGLGFPERKQARLAQIRFGVRLNVEVPDNRKDHYTLSGKYLDIVYEQVSQLIAERGSRGNPLEASVYDVQSRFVGLTEEEILAAPAALAAATKPAKGRSRRS